MGCSGTSCDGLHALVTKRVFGDVYITCYAAIKHVIEDADGAAVGKWPKFYNSCIQKGYAQRE